MRIEYDTQAILPKLRNLEKKKENLSIFQKAKQRFERELAGISQQELYERCVLLTPQQCEIVGISKGAYYEAQEDRFIFRFWFSIYKNRVAVKQISYSEE